MEGLVPVGIFVFSLWLVEAWWDLCVSYIVRCNIRQIDLLWLVGE